MSSTLSADREALALELAQLLQGQSLDTFLEIARTLVAADDEHLFGDTEFKIRKLLLRFGAQAYSAHLEQKKTATRAPGSPAPSASNLPVSTITAPDAP